MPRPRGFDSDHVVDRAMELFWTQGPRRLLRSVDAVLSSLAGPEGLHPHGNE
jgi:hypothetical protein